jgi:hypothetical protein
MDVLDQWQCISSVMAGLVPAIHVLFARKESKTWMPATSAGMTML